MSAFEEMMGSAQAVLTATLGVSATYTPPGGTAVALTIGRPVIPPEVDRVDSDAETHVFRATCLVEEDELETPVHLGVIRWDDKDWVIESGYDQQLPGGRWRLVLRRDSILTRGREGRYLRRF